MTMADKPVGLNNIRLKVGNNLRFQVVTIMSHLPLMLHNMWWITGPVYLLCHN